MLWRLDPPALHSTTKGVLWTDSKSSMEKNSTERGIKSFSNKEAVSKEFAIISEIRKRRNNFPRVQIKWVESHQNITRKEQKLNGVSDKVASMQHGVARKWKREEIRMILPNEIVQFRLDGDLCESCIEIEVI